MEYYTAVKKNALLLLLLLLHTTQWMDLKSEKS